MLDFLLFLSPFLILLAVFGGIEYICQVIHDRRSYHQRLLKVRRLRR